MHLYKTTKGIVLQTSDRYYIVNRPWDQLVNVNNLYKHLLEGTNQYTPIDTTEATALIEQYLLPPIGSQEVWAAGVTYLKSRDARMEESEASGAADCYQRVYNAERPELFFKSLPHRVAGHQQTVNIRTDSIWNVPEPELALYINTEGTIQGYTIGNDMSSRSIEGENPLYLPQAKTYHRSAALGPCLYVIDHAIPADTVIHMRISRHNETVFVDATTLSQMKRPLTELVSYLYREMDFEPGCYLMTGTCVVPSVGFTLQPNDTITITIDNIGTMVNYVTTKQKES